jgi:hypothetical protein
MNEVKIIGGYIDVFSVFYDRDISLLARLIIANYITKADLVKAVSTPWQHGKLAGIYAIKYPLLNGV